VTTVNTAVMTSALIANSAASGIRRNALPKRDRGSEAKAK